MELLLIRHALPIRRELTEGVADPELSEAGVAQALHLAEYLASEELHAIYASPLKRAQQTAAPLAERFRLEVTLVDGVAEFDPQLQASMCRSKNSKPPTTHAGKS